MSAGGRLSCASLFYGFSDKTLPVLHPCQSGDSVPVLAAHSVDSVLEPASWVSEHGQWTVESTGQDMLAPLERRSSVKPGT